MRICNRNRKKIVLCALILSLSLSCFVMTSCGGDKNGQKINALYISQREIDEDFQVERLYCYPDGTCQFDFTWGTFRGTYTWDQENNRYVLDMAPGGAWPETIYYAVKDGEDVLITGAVFEDAPFIYQGKAK